MKKLTVILLVVLMLCLQAFSGAAAYGEEGDGPYYQPDFSQYIPKLGTVTGNKIPAIVAGQSQKMIISVRNDSIYQARNITMTLKMVEETKAPFVLENLDLRQKVDYINGNDTRDVEFEISILSTAPEGLYALKLNYDFENAYNYHFTSSETVYIRVVNNNVNPRLAVDGVSIREAGTTSGAILLDLKIKNLGSLAAREIKVTLGGLKSGGFTSYNSTDVRYINRINGGASETVTYQLLMPASGAAANNELSVKMDYIDTVGSTYSETNQIFVPVGEDRSAKPGIVLENITAPQEAVDAGEDFEVALDLKNSSGSTAKNIKVSLTADQAVVSRTLNPVYIESLDVGTKKRISFTLFAGGDAVTKNYPIAINVEYEDIFGNKYNAAQYVGVYVENKSGSKTVPRIIIDNYSMDPFPVNAGSDFKLKMSFLNTSKTVDVSNIKVTVTSEDGTFTPTESGNTFYLESIPSKQSVERELMLHVKPDAEQKSYMLTVDFEYEDDKGNPYTAKETMSVRVLQNPRLVVGDISMMTDAYVGQPVSLYVDFYNMGKSTLYNLMVKIEGDFQGQGLSYFVGNFEPGRSDYFDVSFTPMNVGNQTGNVLFTFEDANGKVMEVRKEFSLNVMEMQQQGPMLDKNGMPIEAMPGKEGMPGGMNGAGKKSILVYIIPAAAVLIAAVIVFIILRKRHVRRKEMSLDE